MGAAGKLRIYSPDQVPATTLRMVFTDTLFPKLTRRKRKRKPKTIQEYGTLLNDWERLTDNLCASKLTESLLLEFQEQLQQEPMPNGEFRSPATVNKKFRTLKPLIKLCWPADSHNSKGLGLCDYFEFPEPLPEDDLIPYTFSHNELNRLYQAAGQLRWPKKQTALTWRTILVTHFCCGPRTFDLLSLEWSGVDFDYKGVGCLTYRAEKTGKLQRIPLHPAALAHLQELKKASSSDRLFPQFGYSNKSTIRRHWRRLKELAKLPVHAVMEDLRKTCNTAYNDRWPGVGDFILGHRLSGVNAKHYYNPTRKVFHAVKKLRVPESFQAFN